MTTPRISIIIATLNDTEELNHTLRSIMDTAPLDPAKLEIVVVDDCSGCPIWIDDKRMPVTVINNRHRCGVGPSRHIGILKARGDWLLITDSHMRFPKGWYEEAVKLLSSTPQNVVVCATCLQLDPDHMDINHPMCEYRGATFNWLGPDKHNPALEQILECVWLPKEQAPKDLQEIPAIMGACYFMSWNWYMQIMPLRFLRSWGGDELMIAMKTHLAGGRVIYSEGIRIAHRWGRKDEPKMFNNPSGHTLWNKAFAAWTLLPRKHAVFFEDRILNSGRKEEARDREACRAMIRNDWHLVLQERYENQRIFVTDAEAVADRLGVSLPRI